MSRHISRSLLRSSATPSFFVRAPQTRRLLSTAPPSQKSRSWKNSAVRWGLAAGAVYYYNMSPLFADNVTLLEPLLPDSPTNDTSLPTLESVVQSRKQTISSQSSTPAPTPAASIAADEDPSPSPLDPSATEAQASQEGAFNEETGEINWDCPCLGGMADGPCGPQFKEAFSCFVFSKEEPKGMDCIDRFKGMQDCFRQYPEIYGGELEEAEVERELADREASDDEREMQQIQPPTPPSQPPPADIDLGLGQKAASFSTASASAAEEITPAQAPDRAPSAAADKETDYSEEAKTVRAKEAKKQVEKEHSLEPLSETDELVLKAAHDATAASGKGVQ
ncbi:MAG: hypothetical protein L6R37_000152 [Teloschistes peruensis]|nr:MAG: hypothetical protein L6R37_000152 [Teloschistes peruensis]